MKTPDQPSTSASDGGSQPRQIPGEPSVRQRLQQMAISESTNAGQQSQSQSQQQRIQQQTTGKQLGAKPKQLPRTQSIQSVQSDDSQGAWGGAEPSTSTSSAKKQQKETSTPDKNQEAMKNVNKLMVAYKGKGTKGRSLGNIETNYVKLNIGKMNQYAYHYDVTIEPDRPKKLLMKVFLKFVEINFPKATIAFDGTKNAYAAAKLLIGDIQRETKIIHPETGAERTFTVSIQEAHDSRIPIKDALTK